MFTVFFLCFEVKEWTRRGSGFQVFTEHSKADVNPKTTSMERPRVMDPPPKLVLRFTVSLSGWKLVAQRLDLGVSEQYLTEAGPEGL